MDLSCHADNAYYELNTQQKHTCNLLQSLDLIFSLYLQSLLLLIELEDVLKVQWSTVCSMSFLTEPGVSMKAEGQHKGTAVCLCLYMLLLLCFDRKKK